MSEQEDNIDNRAHIRQCSSIIERMRGRSSAHPSVNASKHNTLRASPSIYIDLFVCNTNCTLWPSHLGSWFHNIGQNHLPHDRQVNWIPEYWTRSILRYIATQFLTFDICTTQTYTTDGNNDSTALVSQYFNLWVFCVVESQRRIWMWIALIQTIIKFMLFHHTKCRKASNSVITL